MLKRIAIGILSTLVVGAVGASAYHAVTTRSSAAEAAIAALASEPQQIAGETTPLINGQNQAPAGNSGQATQPEAGTAQWGAGLAPQGSGNPAPQQGQGQMQARGRGQQGGGGSAARGIAVPDPQNDLQEWVILEGTLGSYTAPDFTLLTADGQAIAGQLGNLNYLSNQGLTLAVGDRLQIVGFWESSGALAVGQITQLDSGITIQLRDDLGRPSWRGSKR